MRLQTLAAVIGNLCDHWQEVVNVVSKSDSTVHGYLFCVHLFVQVAATIAFRLVWGYIFVGVLATMATYLFR